MAWQDRKIVTRARKLQRYLTQPFRATARLTGIKGVTVTLDETLSDCEHIVTGTYDAAPESACYMRGTMALMRKFAIDLSSQERYERVEDIVSFVGADLSGSFGILGGREPLATTLSWGLCSFRTGGSDARQYVAVPGGVLYFAKDVLHICARLYLRDDDPERIVTRLEGEMRQEEESSKSLHALLRDLDRELMQRLLARVSSDHPPSATTR